MKHIFENFVMTNSSRIQSLTEEIRILRREIRIAREAAEITANFVVRQFEETEKLLSRFQTANAQRKAVLDSASQIAIIATDINGIITVFNTGAENLLGYRAEEIIGKHTPLIIHSESELAEHGDKLSAECGRKIPFERLDAISKTAVFGEVRSDDLARRNDHIENDRSRAGQRFIQVLLEVEPPHPFTGLVHGDLFKTFDQSSRSFQV